MVLKALGPKLIMIQKMVTHCKSTSIIIFIVFVVPFLFKLYDLSFFILIVLIFVILFGVTTQLVV